MIPPLENHLKICVLVTADFLARVKVGRLVESTVARFNWIRGAKNGPVSAVILLITQILADLSLLSVVWDGNRVDHLTGVGVARVHGELITA